MRIAGCDGRISAFRGDWYEIGLIGVRFIEGMGDLGGLDIGEYRGLGEREMR